MPQDITKKALEKRIGEDAEIFVNGIIKKGTLRKDKRGRLCVVNGRYSEKIYLEALKDETLIKVEYGVRDKGNLREFKLKYYGK